MSKRAIMLHYDSIEQLELLNDEERGRVLLDLLRYARDGEIPEYSNPSMKMMFSILKQRTDAEAQKYEEICRKRSKAGIRGNAVKYGHDEQQYDELSQKVASVANASKCSQVSQKVANLANNKNNNIDISSKEYISDNISPSNEGRVRKKKSTRFIPPTLEDVKRKMAELNYTRFTAEEFLAFYEQKKWIMTNGKHVRSWESCLVTWEYGRKKDEEDKNEKERRSNDVNSYWDTD